MKALAQRTAQALRILLGLLGAAACSPEAVDENGLPQVVSTSTMIADWVEVVGGAEIEHTGILVPGVDPHIYEPVPADSIAMEEAELIFYNGYNLEPKLIKLMNAVGTQARKIALAERVDPLVTAYEGRMEPDPHVWGDVQNVIPMVNAIRDALIELSPADEATFTNNAAAFRAKLVELDTWVQQQINTIPEENRTLVTTHDAFEYYINAYGLRSAGTLIGISTEEQPSAQTVARLADDIEAANIPAIFAETTINPALITTVAEEAGVTLAERELYSDSIGEAGGEADSYVKMIAANTRTIVEALGGRFEDFGPDR
ncbi:MAG: zinc ABC transporter solute-binding protein [Synechococcaceae cyanobacterium SM2_3_1]|nr:zinc ABC transporter solute-binding protein [Synechococcaceae cyanobacterium SM2_3_1]